jgi:hypothetical protein
MPTHQGINDRGLIGRYDYSKLDLSLTGKFYVDDSNKFTTKGFGEVFNIDEITNEGGGVYEIKLLGTNDLSNIIDGAIIRLVRIKDYAEIQVVATGVTDTNVIEVKSVKDISQEDALGVAYHHPFYGGLEVLALEDSVIVLEEDNAYGVIPASIALKANEKIKTSRILELEVTSGSVAITLL